MDKVILPHRVYKDVVKITRVLFPMEVSGVLTGEVKRGAFLARNVVLPPGLAIKNAIDDLRYYRKARDFRELLSLMRKREDVDRKLLQVMVKLNLEDHMKEARSTFRRLKQHQRAFKTTGSEMLGTDSIPRLGYSFDEWVSEDKPFLCWHSHPISSYGSLAEVCVPSISDVIEMLILMKEQTHKTRLKGQIIIAISENGENLIKAFSSPPFVSLATRQSGLLNQRVRYRVQRIAARSQELDLLIK